ncbi:MAG: 50S ribosomal protein L28 [Candidatus Coatesbacteria bacterium]|nr:50S ribosomal protein L28 [Candidatus Coatesbacteria bacterium]
MARVCDICGKKPLSGHKISHAHNVSNRRWLPNLQTVRAVVDGNKKRIKVCASCLKAGKVEKYQRTKPKND